VDFIAIDLDKYDVWQAFIQPMPVRAQMYVKTANWNPEAPPEDGCEGGIDDTECTVTGTQPDQNTIGQASPSFGGSGPDEGYQEPGADPNNGFGGGGLTEEMLCEQEQEDESEIDEVSNTIVERIRGLNNLNTDPDNVEFGSFVLRLDNGQIRQSPLGRGETGQISLRDLYNAAVAAFPGIDASNIVRMIHLHPRNSGAGFENVSDLSDLGALDYGNVMPSHPNISPGPNDWENVRSFLLNNGRTSVEDASHTIVGPDGVAREYDYSDGHPAESTEQAQLIENAELDARGKCQ
jgi:hypothetical protein